VEMLRQIFSVLFVFALLGAALWALRRWNHPGGQTASRGKSLQSIERLSLSPQHSLHLVEIEGSRFMVATHPQGCTLLKEWKTGAGA
jgi:flagellar biosynthetic protein FliO